jgi:hypothetical protein
VEVVYGTQELEVREVQEVEVLAEVHQLQVIMV